MNHKSMTDEELVRLFDSVSRQRVQQILKKYQTSGDTATVEKIIRAKKILRERRHKLKYGDDEDRKRATVLFRQLGGRVGRHAAYKDCKIAWQSEKDFKEWAITQIGFGREGFELDKDILVKGNRTYGPDVCVFVPLEINVLFSGCYKAKRRGDYPIGVSYNRGSNSFVAQMSSRQDRGLNKYLGSFQTVEEAFACYKAAKEAKIKRLANKWKDLIDPRAYAALMARTIEWDD